MEVNANKISPEPAVAATRRPLLALAATLLLPLTANATVYKASTNGSPYSIATALAEAGPGDTISLADGTYDEPIVSVAGGEKGSPILITGGRDAVIQGAWGDMLRAVSITHSWITLQGFSVDGLVGSEDDSDSYIDKCVYVLGQGDPTSIEYEGETVESSLVGFIMNDMAIANCGGECVRLKNHVTNSEITDNTISNCGVHDFVFDEGGENGEAIYIGTSSNQWSDSPDGTSYNIVSGNTITPNANECVDMKEGTTGNVVEYNECSNQLDPDSGCYDSRGSGNIIRYNVGSSCTGAGARLGGWEVDGVIYGRDNDVYDNYFTSTKSGSVVARQTPQGMVCGNTCEDGECTAESEDGSDSMLTMWDRSCDSSTATSAGYDSSFGRASVNSHGDDGSDGGEDDDDGRDGDGDDHGDDDGGDDEKDDDGDEDDNDGKKDGDEDDDDRKKDGDDNDDDGKKDGDNDDGSDDDDSDEDDDSDDSDDSGDSGDSDDSDDSDEDDDSDD